MVRTTETMKELRNQPCHYCTAARGSTFDHIVPEYLGGRYLLWNLVPACPACNHAKGGAWPTCQCPKCRESVYRHVSDPAFVIEMVRQLDRQQAQINKGIRQLETRLEELKANRLDFLQYRQNLTEELTITPQPRKVEA